MVLGSVWSNRTFQVNCEGLKQCARWWKEFGLLGIQFSEQQFREGGNAEYFQQFIAPLLEKTDLENALEFAQTYHLSEDGVLFEFIKWQFLVWVDSQDRHSMIASAILNVANKGKCAEYLLSVIQPIICKQ
jgi:hypothetical protein